jgi:hypothetical protein
MAAISLVGASPASAATEFGDTCAANETAPGDYTLTTLVAPPGPLPLIAPTAGVITKLKVRIDPGETFPVAVPISVKVLRSAGETAYSVINQTTVPVSAGLTVVDARLPVQAGDRLGLHGEPFTYEGSPVPGRSFYCVFGEETSVLGAVAGDVAPGSTASFGPATTGRVPLAAIIEPDADKDGYGDETQDKCPQSAALQTACPAITLGASSIVKKRLVTVLVTTTSQAPVTVVGTAKLGKGKSATLNGGTQIVAPGVLAKFTLPFSKALKSKLKQLSPKQRLSLTLTATATSAAGQPSNYILKVKLKGQAKPKHKGAKGKGHA